uniref:histidine phosphatase family protein n=1 Tax=Orrella sp. TaxID=1921583 RepID=UPI004055792A
MTSNNQIFIQPLSVPRVILLTLAAIALALAWPNISAAQSQDKASLILHLRHAIAPGGGDPAHFDVNDCRTQRNLSDQGREQSRQISAQLKSLGIVPTQVWSSQWCRSTETAQLMNVGEVTPLPALNSFFQNPSEGPAQIAELQTFIRELDPKGGPYVMVSHQVVISGLNNTFVSSGDGVWMALTGDPNEPWRTYPANTQTLALPTGF